MCIRDSLKAEQDVAGVRVQMAGGALQHLLGAAADRDQPALARTLGPEGGPARLRAEPDVYKRQRPVYVHCHSGLRSYIACRILAGHGYDCYNLAGGYRLYASAVEERSIPDYRCADCG